MTAEAVTLPRALPAAPAMPAASPHSPANDRPAPDLRGLPVTFIAGTLGPGGAERQLYYQLKVCCELGIDTRLLCLTKGERWEAPIRALGVPVEWVGASPSRARRAFLITSHVRRHGAQIVQSAHFYTNLYAALAGRVTGARDIGAVRSDALAEVAADPRLGSASLRLPRWVAANSQRGLQNALGLGRDATRTVFLPNAVDTDAFHPALSPGPRPFTVLGVGRQDDAKRIDDFLRVFARFRSHADTDVRALVVGDGPNHERLLALAADLGLTTPACTFLTRADDMSAIYQQADVLLVTSEREGTSNVVLEAMASGLPVVAARVGDLAEALPDGAGGHLRDLNDLDGMAQALEALRTSPDTARRMGRRNRKEVLDRHSGAGLRQALSHLYQEVLG